MQCLLDILRIILLTGQRKEVTMFAQLDKGQHLVDDYLISSSTFDP